MLNVSGRRYSSSSSSTAAEDEGDEEDGEDEALAQEGEMGVLSESRRASCEPIFSFGTRCERWK